MDFTTGAAISVTFPIPLLGNFQGTVTLGSGIRLELIDPPKTNTDPTWVSNPQSVEIGFVVSGNASLVPRDSPAKPAAATVLPSGSTDANTYMYVRLAPTAGGWLPSDLAIDVEGTATSEMTASLASLLRGASISGKDVPVRTIPSSELTLDVTRGAANGADLTAQLNNVTHADVIASAAILIDAIVAQARKVDAQSATSVRGPTSLQIQQATRTLIANSDVSLTLSRADSIDVSFEAALPGHISGLAADGSLTSTRLIAALYSGAGTDLATSTTCVP